MSSGTVLDLTPEPLTATNLVGPWVLALGRPGFVEVQLSNTTTPEAVVVLEASNMELSNGKQIWGEETLMGASDVAGDIVFAGPVKVRLRVVSITGTNAAVNGTIAWS